MMRAVLAVLVAVVCLGWAGTARAHAVLLETVPSDRSVVAEPPEIVILRFNETVRPITVELRDASASRIAADAISVDHEIHIVPRNALEPGAYFLSYRVTSGDSHPVAGSVLFAVGRAPAEWMEPGISLAAYTGWTWAAAVNRSFFLAATFLSVGGLMFVIVVRGAHPLRPLIRRAAAVGIVTAIVGIYLQGGVLLDAADVSPWDGEIWRVGGDNTRGQALLLAASGLLLCTVRLLPIATLGVLAVVASFALSGHASTASPQWIAIPTLLLHVGAVAFWLGSLVPLIAALPSAHPVRLGIFRRFSDLAAVLVPQLMLAGLILAILQIRTPDAVFASAYGLLLSLKVSFVALLLVIAACNRWILLPEMIDHIDGHAARFRRAIQAELALGFAILCATAFVAQTVPPRSTWEHEIGQAGDARGAGQTVLIAARERKALLIVSPARPGRNTIRVRILSGDDRVLDPIEVTIDLLNAEAGIEPLQRKLASIDDGYFEYSGPELAVTGHWTIRIDALIDDFQKAIFETEILVK
jgi:copper transport protein